jgi:alkylation response protein AidB-like acyl-CoA dehydrogenase
VGLNTTELKTRAERHAGAYRVNGEKIWISTAQVANKMLLLARTTPLEQVRRKTEGLSLFYTSLDRTKIDVRLIHNMRRHAVDSNMLFIQDLWIPEEDRIGVDQGQECGIEANAGKYLSGEFGFEACHTAMLTLGGMGYAQEFPGREGSRTSEVLLMRCDA